MPASRCNAIPVRRFIHIQIAAIGACFEASGQLQRRMCIAGERVRLIVPKGGQVWVRLGDLTGAPMPARIRS